MPQPVLNLGLLSAASKDATARRGEESKLDHAVALQEEPIQFKKGHTIAVLKAFLEDEYELKQEETQLCLEDTVLLDPFSLTDFPCVLEASAVEIQTTLFPFTLN
ncbi:hypothetical protein BBJ29_006748 [Phytophthora kernoviae]|uniref:Ubiquitin-like domain-containing protein n=1 Tax=Phytophthora kernoviae TaxID=325452 RepID=A0A3F2RFG8_9STRA|nr:hypothetical protein BBJ29_006748 [Phytophthora kernoviae]RLN55677.1 hypothetical protein BBP00_00008388 [Phytophthora kernoviae]